MLQLRSASVLRRLGGSIVCTSPPHLFLLSSPLARARVYSTDAPEGGGGDAGAAKEGKRPKLIPYRKINKRPLYYTLPKMMHGAPDYSAKTTSASAAAGEAKPSEEKHEEGKEEEDHEEEHHEEEGHGPKIHKELKHGRYPIKAHVEYLSDPYPDDSDPSKFPRGFLTQYYSLYLMMAFLLRHRRNLRYAEYLRLSRARTSMAEDLPLFMGSSTGPKRGDGKDVSDPVLLTNLYLLKRMFMRNALDQQMGAMDQQLGQIRSLMQTQAGSPQRNEVTLRNMYQNLFFALHNCDQAYYFDRVLPGNRGLLLPYRNIGAAAAAAQAAAPAQTGGPAGGGRMRRGGRPTADFPFVVRQRRVVMLRVEKDVDDDGDVRPVQAVTPTQPYQVLGTLPNVLPRRQLQEYYQLFLRLKKEGALPPRVAADPYRAMRAFYKSWISWAHSQQREILRSQRRVLRDTISIASRFIRYHNQNVRPRMMNAVLGTRPSPKMDDMLSGGGFRYKMAVIDLFLKTLSPYVPTVPPDVLRRTISQTLSAYPPSPAELFEKLWLDVFKQREMLSRRRLVKMRKVFLNKRHRRLLQQRRAAGLEVAPVDRTVDHQRVLRWYLLIKTVLAMTNSPQNSGTLGHSSKLLLKMRRDILMRLIELLHPVARLSSTLANSPYQSTLPVDVFHEIGQPPLAPSPLATSPHFLPATKTETPQFELKSNRALRKNYPVCHTQMARYLRDLERYRRNHLLRTRPLRLNETPGGPIWNNLTTKGGQEIGAKAAA